jgi:hypothetical protein
VIVAGVWLCRVYKFGYDDAVDVVETGKADLLFAAREIDIDIEH